MLTPSFDTLQSRRPNAPKQSWVWWTFLAVLIGALSIGWLFLHMLAKPRPTPPRTPGLVTNVDFNRLPDRFPAEIPFFKGQSVLENFTVDRGATFESTREYVSDLSVPETLADYQKYFLSNGWQLLTMVTVKSEKIVYGRKGSTQLFFSVKPGPYNPTSTSEINLSLTYPQ